MKLFLLLALMLPLQSFAWVNCGSPAGASLAVHQHCHDSAGGTQTSHGLAQQHHCGSCCVAAVAAAPLRFAPPSFTSPAISLPARRPPIKGAPDRLDRPPRYLVS